MVLCRSDPGNCIERDLSPNTVFERVQACYRFGNLAMQLYKSGLQKRDRTGIERLHTGKPGAQRIVQSIAGRYTPVRQADEPLTLFAGTVTQRLYLLEPLREHIDRESSDLQFPGKLE
jgi:hypothetical protein